MHADRPKDIVTPEHFTEEVMLLLSSNMPLEEMRLRIEQLFRRAIGVGALSGTQPPDDHG